MTNIKNAFISFVLIMTGLLLLSGCTANQQDMEYYKTEFLKKADEFVKIQPNNNKVLNEIRTEAKKGMKRTKVQNSIDQGKNHLELVQEDFMTSQVPQELEPIKAKILKIIELKIKAYEDLFFHYDMIEESKFEKEADKKLAEANRLYEELKVDLEKYNK